MKESKELGDRKEKLISFFKENKTISYYVAFILTILIGVFIRTRNLKILGNYPLALDPHLFYRYAEYIVEHGKLMTLDMMRYVPIGYDTTGERGIIVSYIIAYIYKFFHVFMPSLKIITINNLYPVIFFVLTLIVFFLLVKRLFGIQTALISSIFLTILPAFLYRTMAGFSDKEALGLFLMFATFYFYVVGWQSKTQRNNIIFGALSGLFSFIMAISWGGYQFVILPISIFVLIEFFLNKVKRPDALVYISWLALFLIPYIIYLKIISGTALFSIIKSLLVSFSTVIPIFVLLTLSIRYLLEKKFQNIILKIKEKLPYGILSLAIAFIISITTTIILFGISIIPHRLSELKEQIISPIGTSRFVKTVAEAHQTYFISDWTSNFGPLFLNPFFSSNISQCNPLHTGIPLYFALFFIGSILLFYHAIKKLPRIYKISLTTLYTIFISALIFTKTINNSTCTFNGSSPFSTFIFLSSLILFFIIIASTFIFTFYKRKSIYKEILNINKRYAFIFILFVLTILAARGAQRLFVVLGPMTAILAAYTITAASRNILKKLYNRRIEIAILALCFISIVIGILPLLFLGLFFYKTIFLWIAVVLILTFGLFEILKTEKQYPIKNYKYLEITLWIILILFIAFIIFNFSTTSSFYRVISLLVTIILIITFGVIEIIRKDYKYTKITSWIILMLFTVFIIFSFSHDTFVTAQYTGPSFNGQWQNAASWVKTNTPEENTVFAHWWDYGYWVQTGWQRATILDGGNAIYYWDYLMGRHVLTGQSEREALEFLYSHNATHLLIIQDEIGKYPAYASIGSDEKMDRYSYIPMFTTNPNDAQETRDAIVYIYQGQFVLDKEFIYNNKIYPSGGSAIVGFFVPLKTINGSTFVDQPTAVLIDNQGQRSDVPLECIYFNGQEINYPNKGIKGCLRFIPTLNAGSDQANLLGAAYYVSEKVRPTLFAQMYLFEKQWPHFNLVYNDEQTSPLILYQGQQIGPLKIWEINYPPDMKVNPVYLQRNFPEEIESRIK